MFIVLSTQLQAVSSFTKWLHTTDSHWWRLEMLSHLKTSIYFSIWASSIQAAAGLLLWFTHLQGPLNWSHQSRFYDTIIFCGVLHPNIFLFIFSGSDGAAHRSRSTRRRGEIRQISSPEEEFAIYHNPQHVVHLISWWLNAHHCTQGLF